MQHGVCQGTATARTSLNTRAVVQSEFARLHRITAEMREAVSGAEGRARGEESFRRRAEQGECLGWPPMASDGTLMSH